MSRTSFPRPLALAAGFAGATALLCAGAVPAHAHVDVVYTWTANDATYLTEISAADASPIAFSYPFGTLWTAAGTERDKTTSYSLMDYDGFNVAAGGATAGAASGSVTAAADSGAAEIHLVHWANDTSTDENSGDDIDESVLIYDEEFFEGALATLRNVWALDINADGALLTLAEFTIDPESDGSLYNVVYIAEIDPDAFTLTPILDVSDFLEEFSVSGIATDPTTGVTYLALANEFGVGYVTVDLETGTFGEPTQLVNFPMGGDFWPGDFDIDAAGHSYFLNGNDELLAIHETLTGDAEIDTVGVIAELQSAYAIAVPDTLVQAPAEDETLPDTGADAGMALAAGAAALGLGALALVAARRRATQH